MIEHKSITMKYDSDIYFWITKTGRLTDLGKLERIGYREPKYLESIKDKQIGPDLIFVSEKKFDTRDLSKILKVHTPLEANSHWENCKNNILTLKFYKI